MNTQCWCWRKRKVCGNFSECSPWMIPPLCTCKKRKKFCDGDCDPTPDGVSVESIKETT